MSFSIAADHGQFSISGASRTGKGGNGGDSGGVGGDSAIQKGWKFSLSPSTGFRDWDVNGLYWWPRVDRYFSGWTAGFPFWMIALASFATSVRLYSGRFRIKRPIKWRLIECCLALGVASGLMMTGSYFYEYGIFHSASTRSGRIWCRQGGVCYLQCDFDNAPPAGWSVLAYPKKPPTAWDDLAYGCWPKLYHTHGVIFVGLPLWMVTFPSLAVSAFLYRDVRRSHGWCECGYDTLGLPASAPCPECGGAVRSSLQHKA